MFLGILIKKQCFLNGKTDLLKNTKKKKKKKKKNYYIMLEIYFKNVSSSWFSRIYCKK